MIESVHCKVSLDDTVFICKKIVKELNIAFALFSILSGCYDNTVRLWKTDGTPLMAIPGHTDPVKCVCWITEGEQPTGFYNKEKQTYLLQIP